MISIKDLLNSFKLKTSPDRELRKIIQMFFKEKGVIVPENISITYKGKTIKIMGDPYVAYYVKANSEEIVSYLKGKTSFDIEKVE